MKPLNTDDSNNIESLYRSGKRVDEICATLGLGNWYVSSFIRESGLTKELKGVLKLERGRKNREKLLPQVKELSELCVAEIARLTGIHERKVVRCLGDLEIKPLARHLSHRNVSKGIKKMHRDRRAAHLIRVEKLFSEGYPVNRIAKTIGIGRATVGKCLDDLGIEKPSISEGNSRSAALASPDSRRKRAAMAHLSARISGVSEITRSGKSIVNMNSKRYVGFGETEVIAELSRRGIKSIGQAAVHGYNIDILIGNLAVEIHNYKRGPNGTTQTMRRTVKLLSSGYSVCYIWLSTGEIPGNAAIENLISFYNLTSADPSPRGQYRVIKGDGEIHTLSSAYLDDIADVFSTYSSL